MRRMQNENLSSFFKQKKTKTGLFFPTSFPRYSQMAKLQLCSPPLRTLITFDGHPAAEFQGWSMCGVFFVCLFCFIALQKKK